MPVSIDLIVPGICGPFSKNTTIPDDASTQLLLTTLQHCKVTAAASSFQQQLSQCLNYPHKLPLAALSLFARSEEYAHSHVMYVDPIHLQADMDHAILFDREALQLDRSESDALVQELHTHFTQDALQIITDEAAHWYLISEQPIQIDTVPVSDVIARNVNFFLPTGEHASHWKHFLNEAQMLLHMSEVNQQRELAGKLPANSVWLWGEGSLPDTLEQRYQHFVSDSRLLAGLARLGGSEYAPLSSSDSFTLSDGDTLVCDTRCMSAACYSDVTQWREQLTRVIEETIVPVMRSAAGKAARVSLYDCAGRMYVLQKPSWFSRFMKRSLDEFIHYDD